MSDQQRYWEGELRFWLISLAKKLLIGGFCAGLFIGGLEAIFYFTQTETPWALLLLAPIILLGKGLHHILSHSDAYSPKNWVKAPNAAK